MNVRVSIDFEQHDLNPDKPLRFKRGDRVAFNNRMLGKIWWPGTIGDVRDSISYDLWLDGKEQPITALDPQLMSEEEYEFMKNTKGV